MSSYNILLSLLPPIFFEILDYCEPCDVMALRFTCRLFKTRIDRTTLGLDREISLDADCVIPIYVADHCHSVVLSYRIGRRVHYGLDHTITIMSRKKHERGPCDTVVWKKNIPSRNCHQESHISFRTDPSLSYGLCYNCHNCCSDYHYTTIRKQFMMGSFTPTRRRALSACRAMRSIDEDSWRPVNVPGMNVMRLFMKLFALSYSSSPEVSSPIQRFVATQHNTIDADAIIQQIFNLFEQALEQKEPMDCRKLPLSIDENQNLQQFWRYEWHKGFYQLLPPLMLNEEFTWKRGKGRHLDQTEDSLYSDGLKFIIRIPLKNKSRCICLKASLDTDSKMPLFVIFFQISQKEQNDPGDAVENLVEGNVVTGDPQFLFSGCYGMEFDVKPEYEACFLYFVPGAASRMVITKIEVYVGIATDAYNKEFSRWMGLLLGKKRDWRASVDEVELPLMLSRACASAIMGPNAQRYAAWKEAFDMEGLDTTTHGLQCIVEIADELLGHPQSDY